MKTEEIIAGNRLLAGFMGIRNTFVRNEHGIMYDYVLHQPFILIKETETTIEGEHCEILMGRDFCMTSELLFNYSWDWLMPVVEKILNICQESDGMEGYYMITDAIPDIQSVFQACVEFAKWYKNKTV